MAPIKIISGETELGRIESENIMRVLMIEDDINVRENTVRRLQEAGYRVDAFETPRDAAQTVQPDRYQLVIVDIRFDAPNISGDEFIFKNRDVFDNAKIVAFTGHEDDITHEQIFDEIFLKGKLRNALFEYAEETYHQRQKALAAKIQTELGSGTGEKGLSDQPKDELIKLLKQTKDREKKILLYKGRDFSANELIDEVQDPTSEVGKSHIKMMVGWLTKKRRDN